MENETNELIDIYYRPSDPYQYPGCRCHLRCQYALGCASKHSQTRRNVQPNEGKSF